MALPDLNEKCYLLSSAKPEDYTYVRKWLENHEALNGAALEVLVTGFIKSEYTSRIDQLQSEIAGLKSVAESGDHHAAAHAKGERKHREAMLRDAVKRHDAAGLGSSTFKKCFEKTGGTRGNQEAILRFIRAQESIDPAFKDSLSVTPKSQLGKLAASSKDADNKHPPPTAVGAAAEHPPITPDRPSASLAILRRWPAVLLAILAVVATGFALWPSGRVAEANLDVYILPNNSQVSVPLSQAAMPVTFGDGIRFEVESNENRRFYLLWLDACGDLQPLSPWRDFDWQQPVVPAATDQLQLPAEAKRHLTIRVSDVAGCSGKGIHTVFLVVARRPIQDFEPLQRAVRDAGYGQDGIAPEQEGLRCRIAMGDLLTMQRTPLSESEERAVVAPDETRDARSPVLIVQELIESGVLPNIESVDAVCFAVGDRFDE